MQRVLLIYSQNASYSDKFCRWYSLKNACQDYFGLDSWGVNHFSDCLNTWKNPTFHGYILTINNTFDAIVFDIACKQETMEFIKTLAPFVPYFMASKDKYEFLYLITQI